jgi:hypothetical protein
MNELLLLFELLKLFIYLKIALADLNNGTKNFKIKIFRINLYELNKNLKEFRYLGKKN